MANFVNKYLNQSAYDADNTKQYPNTSLVGNEIVFQMEKTEFNGIIATYNVEDASQQTLLYGYYAEEGQEEYWIKGVDLFDKVEIDGTEVSVADLDAAQGKYQFSTVGEHTVAYTLKNPTSIGDYVFYQCTSLTSVNIPNSVTSIGRSAFQDCSGLTSVTIGDGVTSIGDSAFESCSSLTSVTIGDGVTSIGENAFAGCGGLTSVTIPNSVTSLGGYAFYECIGLTSITIPSGVTSIGDSAFRNCSGLTSVTIPNSVTSIGNYAFYDCSSLTSVTVQATTPPTLGIEVLEGTNANLVIYVPSESVNAYKAATNWSTYASRIQAIQ